MNTVPPNADQLDHLLGTADRRRLTVEEAALLRMGVRHLAAQLTGATPPRPRHANHHGDPMTKRTARQEIERAFHVSFKLPEEAAKLLDAYRDEVREEVAQEIDAAGLRNRAEYPDLDAILDAADQDGWWTMPRPQVEQLIAEVRRLQADRDEMAHLRDAALRALHRDDIDTNLDVERAIADNLCGPGWWDDDTPSKVARELTPVIRPALAKATQQRDQALARVRELETQLTKYVALDLEEPDGRISATCPDAALDAYRAEVLAEGAALIRDQVTSHTYCADRLTSARTPAS